MSISTMTRAVAAFSSSDMQSDDMARLVKTLRPYLTAKDAYELHKVLATQDCNASDCPCYENGLQAGYATQRKPLER